MVNQFLELTGKLNIAFDIVISIGDSLGEKGKAPKYLDAVDMQHNHNQSNRKKQAYINVYVYVFGQLLVLSFYQQFKAEGEAFKSRYLNVKFAETLTNSSGHSTREKVDIINRDFVDFLFRY